LLASCLSRSSIGLGSRSEIVCEGRLQLGKERTLAGAPIEVIGRIVRGPELPFRVLIFEFWQPLFHDDKRDGILARTSVCVRLMIGIAD
jgi:hypothetical protein